MTKFARYTASAFLLGALAVGVGGASAAAGGSELQTPSAASMGKTVAHKAERCGLKRQKLYLEALRESAAQDH